MKRALLIFQNYTLDVPCSAFAGYFKMCALLFLLLSLSTVTHIWASPIQSIDLGALPVGKATSFKVDVPLAAKSQWITSVDSSCSCLIVERFPQTVQTGSSTFDITFTPNESGPSEVSVTISGLSADSSEMLSQDISFTVVGIDAPAPVQLQTWIQPLDPAALYSSSEHYTIIDIRGPASYAKAHIPGSFEYTLDAFAALSDQFGNNVVLVGDGLLSARERALLEKVGASEKNSLLWLEGGLPAWMRKGLPIQGTWPSQVNVATISLQRWLETGGLSYDWEIVDLTGDAHLRNTFGGHSVHVHNSGSDLGSLLLQVQEDAMRSLNSKGLLVIGDARGLSYPGIEHHDAVSHAAPVYYLNQGDAAVSRWLAAARGAQDSGVRSYVYSSDGNTFSAPGGSNTIRTGRKSGCRSCPKR